MKKKTKNVYAIHLKNKTNQSYVNLLETSHCAHSPSKNASAKPSKRTIPSLASQQFRRWAKQQNDSLAPSVKIGDPPTPKCHTCWSPSAKCLRNRDYCNAQRINELDVSEPFEGHGNATKKCLRDFFPPQNWTLQAWVGPARDCTEIIAALQSAIVPNFQARNHRNVEATSASLLLVNYGPNSGQRIWRNSRDKKDVGLTAVPKKNEPKGELTIVTFSLFR